MSNVINRRSFLKTCGVLTAAGAIHLLPTAAFADDVAAGNVVADVADSALQVDFNHMDLSSEFTTSKEYINQNGDKVVLRGHYVPNPNLDKEPVPCWTEEHPLNPGTWTSSCETILGAMEYTFDIVRVGTHWGIENQRDFKANLALSGVSDKEMRVNRKVSTPHYPASIIADCVFHILGTTDLVDAYIETQLHETGKLIVRGN